MFVLLSNCRKEHGLRMQFFLKTSSPGNWFRMVFQSVTHDLAPFEIGVLEREPTPGRTTVTTSFTSCITRISLWWHCFHSIFYKPFSDVLCHQSRQSVYMIMWPLDKSFISFRSNKKKGCLSLNLLSSCPPLLPRLTVFVWCSEFPSCLAPFEIGYNVEGLSTKLGSCMMNSLKVPVGGSNELRSKACVCFLELQKQ